jgi:hypothetical protein
VARTGTLVDEDFAERYAPRQIRERDVDVARVIPGKNSPI